MNKECMNKTKNGSLISYLQSMHRDVYTSYKEDKSRNKDIYEKNVIFLLTNGGKVWVFRGIS